MTMMVTRSNWGNAIFCLLSSPVQPHNGGQLRIPQKGVETFITNEKWWWNCGYRMVIFQNCLLHSIPSTSALGKSTSWQRVESIKALPRMRVRDNLPNSWLVTRPSSNPLHLAKEAASCLTWTTAPEWRPPSVSKAVRFPVEWNRKGTTSGVENKTCCNFRTCMRLTDRWVWPFPAIQIMNHVILTPRKRYSFSFSYSSVTFFTTRQCRLILTSLLFLSVWSFLPSPPVCQIPKIQKNLKISKNHKNK